METRKLLGDFNVFLLIKSPRDFKSSSAGKSYSSFPATFLLLMPNELSISPAQGILLKGCSSLEITYLKNDCLAHLCSPSQFTGQYRTQLRQSMLKKGKTARHGWFHYTERKASWINPQLMKWCVLICFLLFVKCQMCWQIILNIRPSEDLSGN